MSNPIDEIDDSESINEMLNENESFDEESSEVEFPQKMIGNEFNDFINQFNKINAQNESNQIYFENLDTLMSSYFSDNETNIVVAVQNLEKTMKENTNAIRESIDQNSKCILRIAKLLENHYLKSS